MITNALLGLLFSTFVFGETVKENNKSLDSSDSDEGAEKSLQNDSADDAQVIKEAGTNHDESVIGIPYSLQFKGEIPSDLEGQLKDASLLLRLSDRLPSSLTGLGKRADQDKKKFRKVLASQGYLGGKVSFRISAKPDQAVVKFTINPSERYKVSKINLNAKDNVFVLKDEDPNLIYDILNLHPDDEVSFEKILESAKFLKRYLQDHGYPFVTVEQPIGQVLHQNQKMDVEFCFATGPLGVIESTKIEGLQDINESFVLNRLQWKKGDIYSLKTVEHTSTILGNTQLIASASVEPILLKEEVKTKAKPILMKATIKEVAPRHVGVGLKYSTTDQIGGHFFWHHNNFFGGQEHFGASLKVSKFLKKAKISFDVFDFLSPLQELNTEVFVQKEINPAYLGTTEAATTKIKRPVLDMIQLKAEAGLSVEHANLKQNSVRYPHKIVGIPLGATFDTTTSKLDPASGIRVSGSFTPYFGSLQNTKGFSTVGADASLYLPLAKTELGEPRFILAGFVKFGSLLIKNNAFAPLNKRFYAGGSGSVRAYGFQMIGPLDSNKNPLGGRSKIEIGGEVRFRTTDNWGCVAFMEGAVVSLDKVPTLSQKKDFLYGFGVGVRYFTTFAPIRVDVAVPAKCRKLNGKYVDSPFQFYISIGQAF